MSSVLLTDWHDFVKEMLPRSVFRLHQEIQKEAGPFYFGMYSIFLMLPFEIWLRFL